MSNVRRIGAVLVALMIVGCERRDVPAETVRALESAEQYELLSLQPAPGQDESAGSFHGWRVLGRAPIADAGTRKKLNDALRAGARASDGNAMACFEPRHAIRVTRGGKVTDVLICFECLSAEVYSDGKKSPGFLTTASPQATFDDVLKEAAVPLATEPK